METFNCWYTILKEAFVDGDYNKDRTNKISKKLLCCDIDGSYIELNSIYLIELFGNMQAEISDVLKRNYLKWLHRNGKIIGYTKVILNQGFNNNFSELYKVYFLLSELYAQSIATYSGSNYTDVWMAVDTMCNLFHTLALAIASHCGFAYRQEEEDGIRECLRMMKEQIFS